MCICVKYVCICLFSFSLKYACMYILYVCFTFIFHHTSHVLLQVFTFLHWWPGWQPASLNCPPLDHSPTFLLFKFLYLAADTHLQGSGSFAQASETIRKSCQGQPFLTFNFLVLTLRIQFQGQGFSRAFPNVTTHRTSHPGTDQASLMMTSILVSAWIQGSHVPCLFGSPLISLWPRYPRWESVLLTVWVLVDHCVWLAMSHENLPFPNDPRKFASQFSSLSVYFVLSVYFFKLKALPGFQIWLITILASF